jgi:uncharacterized protein YndB with AHSA1/START domain
MHGPDGTVYRGGGTYHEIVPPERLVFSTTILAEDGTTALAEIRNTLTLTERDGKTELTLGIVIVHVDPAVAHHMAGMEEGWTSSLVCLAEYLER